MKFKIDVEMTPEEFRRLLGLPDVAGLQQEMLDEIRQRMQAGAEGYDPMALFRQQLTGSFGSMDSLQQLMMNMMKQSQGAGKDKDSKSD